MGRAHAVNRFSWRLQHAGHARSEGSAITFSSLVHLDAPPDWVRLIYYIDPLAPWSIDGVAVAPTSSVHDGFSPTQESGACDDEAWRKVTFNSQGLNVDPLQQSGGDRLSFSLSDDRNAGSPRTVAGQVIVLSDWIPLTAVPRSDGGQGNLLLVRTYSHGRLRFSGGQGLPHPALGRAHAGFWSPGNGTVPPWTLHPRKFDAAYAAFGLQYIAAVAGATVAGVGDSIMQGMGSTSGISSFGARACALVSAPGFPVSYFNEGFGGRKSVDYCQHGAWIIEQLKPQVVLIQTWSQNDPNTRAGADAGFALAMALADCALRNRCTPVLVSAAPVFSNQPKLEEHRQRNVVRVREAAARGFHVLDLDDIWGTRTVPNAYRAGLDCGDKTHPSDAACEIAAERLASVLGDILVSAGRNTRDRL